MLISKEAMLTEKPKQLDQRISEETGLKVNSQQRISSLKMLQYSECYEIS